MQILLIGAYIVTVYFLTTDGINGILQSRQKSEIPEEFSDVLLYMLAPEPFQTNVSHHLSDKSETKPTEDIRKGLKFIEVLKWLDRSIFAPLLSERTMNLLFTFSSVLDRLDQVTKPK